MTAAAILRLQRAGFTQEQVDALASYFDDQLATKADLVALRHEIAADVQASEARLEAKLQASRADILKWTMGSIGLQTIVIIGAVIALARVLP